MTDEGTATIGAVNAVGGYAYPGDLARLVRDRWAGREEPAAGTNALPDHERLQEFFAVCFQASMMREEERAVTFRAILAEPSQFAVEGWPPEGLQRLDFTRPLAFLPGELRRLSVTADPRRTLIAVGSDDGGGLRIWGLVHSGTRWLRDVYGGRRAGAPLPTAPVASIDAPGSIAAYRGDQLLGRLSGGRLSGSRLDVFDSEWLPELFIPFREMLAARHEAARDHARDLLGEIWATLDPDLPRRITERLHKRVISVLRAEHHGGTLLLIPLEDTWGGSSGAAYIDLRYQIGEGPARTCFPDLIVTILNRLARIHGTAGSPPEAPVGWQEFEMTTDDEIATLDEALFEMAHLFAGLAAADGAVVMGKDHEILGFGGMISGRLADVRRVWRALDLEAAGAVEEEIGNVGARHRAAYRLAGALPGSVAIVISQDGGVRFVSQRDGRITYWEQE
jgi:hypothetical protein